MVFEVMVLHKTLDLNSNRQLPFENNIK